MSIREYIGARYIPRFVGTYDVTQIYEGLDVVDNGMGTSYIAKKPTPAGTPLTNTTYWAVYGAYSGAIVNLQNQIDNINKEIQDFEGFVCPEDFGAVGDGDTDDTSAIQNAINAAQTDRKTLVFNTNKWYGITTPLTITSPVYINGNNARLVALSSMTEMMNINIPSPIANYGRGLIQNLMFICDYKADRAIMIARNINSVIFEYIQINDALVCGIEADSSFVGRRIMIRNTNPSHLNVIGIQLDGPDNYIDSYSAVNCQKNLIINGNSFINKCTSWNSFDGLMKTSVFAEVNAFTSFIECMIDTWAYGFTGSAMPYLTNCMFFWSTDYYTDASVGDSTTLPVLFTTTPFLENCKGFPPTGRSDAHYKFSDPIAACWYNIELKNDLVGVQNTPSLATYSFSATLGSITANVNKTVRVLEGSSIKRVIHIEGTSEYQFTSVTPFLTSIGSSDRPDYIVTGRCLDITNRKIYGVYYQSAQNRFVIDVAASDPIESGDNLVIDVEYYINL